MTVNVPISILVKNSETWLKIIFSRRAEYINGILPSVQHEILTKSRRIDRQYDMIKLITLERTGR